VKPTPNLPMVNRFDQKLSATSSSDVAVKLPARRRGQSSMSGWSRRELDEVWPRDDRDDRPRKRGHLPERPATGYVTEVSHHHGGRSYCIDPCSLFYQLAALAGPTPGRTRSRSFIPTLAPADAVDYYAKLDAVARPGDTLLVAFSVQNLLAQAFIDPHSLVDTRYPCGRLVGTRRPDLTLPQACGSEVSR
jgi:hypothetical protein